MRNLRADIDYILIDEDKLQSRIKELAHELEQKLGPAENVILVCVLKGGFMFMADLSRALNLPHEVDFMAVSSYGNETHSSGAVQILLDLKKNISGYHVVLVEDIIDSGLTLDYLRQMLLARNPASLNICALLSKPSRHKVQIPVDLLGFEVPDEFVVGYGLDFAQLYRNLPFIAVLKPEVFQK